jgi:hypothetical protein|tara:strand:- start:215 stop:613 length:399 start_codon:yes stop_codon:yes gene_type:complete
MLIPRFQAVIFVLLFLGATYFGYQIVDNATATQVAPQDEKPPTSKPWPWESRRQANQNQLEDIRLKKPDKLDTTILFSHTFPDFYSSFEEKPVDELGQDWDDSLDDTFAKYAPDPHDLQIEASPDLGQNWDN